MTFHPSSFALHPFFKPPAPVREVSLVTRRAFVKKRLIEALKKEILDNLPTDLRRTDDKQVLRIKT